MMEKPKGEMMTFAPGETVTWQQLHERHEAWVRSLLPPNATPLDEALHMLQYADSYQRAHRLLRVLALDPTREAFRLVGETWDCCDNIALYRHELDAQLRRYRDAWGFPIVEAMNAEARAVYDGLPEVVTVYRGCYEVNVHGLSWTLAREVAERFPRLARYRQDGDPMCVTGTVKRQHVAFAMLDRQEAEIVAPWRSVRVVSIEYPPAADAWATLSPAREAISIGGSVGA